MKLEGRAAGSLKRRQRSEGGSRQIVSIREAWSKGMQCPTEGWNTSLGHVEIPKFRDSHKETVSFRGWEWAVISVENSKKLSSK